MGDVEPDRHGPKAWATWPETADLFGTAADGDLGRDLGLLDDGPVDPRSRP